MRTHHRREDGASLCVCVCLCVSFAPSELQATAPLHSSADLTSLGSQPPQQAHPLGGAALCCLCQPGPAPGASKGSRDLGQPIESWGGTSGSLAVIRQRVLHSLSSSSAPLRGQLNRVFLFFLFSAWGRQKAGASPGASSARPHQKRLSRFLGQGGALREGS